MSAQIAAQIEPLIEQGVRGQVQAGIDEGEQAQGAAVAQQADARSADAAA